MIEMRVSQPNQDHPDSAALVPRLKGTESATHSPVDAADAGDGATTARGTARRV